MAAGWTKFAFIPLVLLLGQVDMKDPTILFAARCAFYGAVGVSVLLNFVVKGMVTSANDSTRIWVPPPQTGFMPDPNAQLQETTYRDHELGLIGEGIKKTLIMAAMMSFMTFKLGLHLPVAMQAVMIPLELFTGPLVAKYLLGNKEAGQYGEKLEPPEETAAAAEGADGANAGAGGASGAGSGPRVEEVSAATDKLVNFVITHYNQNTLFTYEQVAPLLTDDTDINAQTPVQPVKDDPDTMVGGMTLLMVACSFPDCPKSLVTQLISRGASVMSTDIDSWTPLHWAAENGSAEAARGLLEVCSGAEGRFMTTHTDNDNNTALALAQSADNGVAAIIEEVTKTYADMDAEDGAEEPSAPSAATEDANSPAAEGADDLGAISDVD